MKLLQKILVPLDFEPASLKALDNAIIFAEYFLSEITLLHVAPSEKVSEKTEKLLMEGILSKMKSLLDNLETEKVKSVEILVEKGNPAEKILHIAESNDMNLIIVGEGNKPENENYKLGTTAEKLMLGKQVPLFVVKNTPAAQVNKVLCPVDFSQSSKRALANAIFLANRLGAKLTILHVFKPLIILSHRIDVDNKKEIEQQLKQQKIEFDDFLKNFHFDKDRHEVKLVEGEPEYQILKEIKNGDIDLLVMGTTGKTGLGRIFKGSVTEKVTREIPCNFIITNESEISTEVFESNLKKIESLIVSARNHFKNEEIEKAIEKYNHVLNQHPDNIPALLGLVKCYKKTGDKQKTAFFNGYIKQVITRSWDKDDIALLDSLT